MIWDLGVPPYSWMMFFGEHLNQWMMTGGSVEVSTAPQVLVAESLRFLCQDQSQRQLFRIP